MSKKCTIEEAITQITESAKNNIADERFVKQITINQVMRQGDIYIHCVDSNHTHGNMCDNKLAKGTSQGSRHYAESPAVCYEGSVAPKECSTTLLGPCIKSPGRFVISHPEHANISIPGGTYQITHQMDARTLERVRD